MGANSSSRSDPNLLNDSDVNFDHFLILRAIGKGSFGKVCIVQKRDSGILYAMKYVSKSACESRGALGGVIKEVELLASLEHPCLVNLWFSFQDEEDLFMVCDLLTGGDLRYHLQNRVEFSEESVVLLVAELGCALEYLQEQRVVHRDIKPDNILLDDAGHAHLTDFNIATRLQKDAMACSMSGTKPYMAPEVFLCALDEVAGYSFPVDWWSLGVVAYEMCASVRPFLVHSNTGLVEIKNILNAPIHYPRYWNPDFIDLLSRLLCIHPGARISSQKELQQTELLRRLDFQLVLKKKTKPPFKPPEDHLNCDPCLELEEMIVETRPLHKKKKRLAKQRSVQQRDPSASNIKEFIEYNRYKVLRHKAMEKKENDWQLELENAMANSIVTSLSTIHEHPNLSSAAVGAYSKRINYVKTSTHTETTTPAITTTTISALTTATTIDRTTTTTTLAVANQQPSTVFESINATHLKNVALRRICAKCQPKITSFKSQEPTNIPLTTTSATTTTISTDHTGMALLSTTSTPTEANKIIVTENASNKYKQLMLHN